MRPSVPAALLLIAISAAAAADIKPDILDCNAKKAARNAALGATVGVSGRCDPGKAAEEAKDNVADNARDAVQIDRDKKIQLDGKEKGDGTLRKHKD